MLPPLFDIEPLIDSINNDALIITANQRLCSKAIDAWGEHLQSQQQSSWRQPRIYTLSQWIDTLWLKLQQQGFEKSLKPIVTKTQEKILWQRITQNCGKMQADKLSQKAASAFKNLNRWSLSLNSLRNEAHLDEDQYQIFIRWCKDYKSLLKKHSLISEEDKINIIIEAFQKEILSLENYCFLVGFDDISPLGQSLFKNAIINDVTQIQNHHQPQSIYQKNFINSSEEIKAAAHWALEILQNNDSKKCRIGIISPELGQNRDEIVQIFTTIFEPQQLTLSANQSPLPFNISAGVPLGKTPFVADTLRLLSLSNRQHTLDDCLHCLYSPFWASCSVDHPQRRQLANALTRLEQFEITDDQLRFCAQKVADTIDDDHHESIFQYLHHINTLKKQWSYHALPSAWVDRLLGFLDTLGWPGERESDSLEYQQHQLFYQVLETFASLDSVLGNLTRQEAIKELASLAKSTPFQAKVADAPIQVLGILEGAGLRFTHCWVMGLNQQFWPPSPSPSPLLPFNFQKKYQMPHATALRELAYARSLTNQYRHCADHIMMSYADHDSTGDIHWQPSKLISDLPLNTASECVSEPLSDKTMQTLEQVSCNIGPAIEINHTEPNSLTGGAGIIKAMVENPFDAFARFRLGAKKTDEPVNGFSAKAKGNILHNSLASIWQTLGSQEELLSTSTQNLLTLVNNAVAHAINDERKGKQHHLKENLCQLEIERQSNLILHWLALEKERPPFTVEHIEKSHRFTINDVEFNLRIDRVDRLTDGSFLIIDYKTATTSLNDWKAEEPRDPQLPLYLLALSDRVSGLAFAQINVKELALKGLHNGEQTMENSKAFVAIGDNRLNLPKSWEEAKNHWQETIEHYLTRYCSGDTSILLKNTNGFNQDLLALNRYFEKERLTEFIHS